MTLADRLRNALADGGHRGAVLLTGDDHEESKGSRAVAAAVLVAAVDRSNPTLLLTRRNDAMRRHAGQIAFPGGRVDPGDEGAIAAALREANEEIGLDPAKVDIVGTFDRYRTVTGYAITPVVGVIPPDLPLVPHDAEVADVFEVPLSFVLEPANHVEQSVEWQGRTRRYYQIVWGDRRIWGATAAIIVNLGRRLTDV